MHFFVPGVPDDDAAPAWKRMRQACEAPKDTRPIYSITYEDEGSEAVATVGEEGVIAIIAGEVFCIFEEPEDWRSVPWDCVTEMVFFDDE